MPSFRKLIGLSTIAIAVSASGTIAGSMTQSALAETIAVCEDDECAHGTYCQANPGGGTECTYTGPSQCVTRTCGRGGSVE